MPSDEITLPDAIRTAGLQVTTARLAVLLSVQGDGAHLGAEAIAVLIGGMRALDANYDGSRHGVSTNRSGALTNDYFVNRLDFGTAWTAVSQAKDVFEGRDRATGAVKWTGTRVDLIFGSNSELRAGAEVYACDDS